MKKSFLLLFLIANSIISFAQDISFKKLIVSDSEAIANQMQKLAYLCNTENLSELDLFRIQLIRGDYKVALSIIEKKIKETPKDGRQYIDVYLHYVKAKLSNNFEEAFKNSYSRYLKILMMLK